MKLKELLIRCAYELNLALPTELLSRCADVEISGVSDDSRLVSKGDLFVAWAGSTFDGKTYLPDAVAAGATCALCDSEPKQPISVPYVVAPELVAARGRLAAAFYGHPSREQTCAGVTGTNGKTTIAYHLAYTLKLLGAQTGYLGTIGWGLPDRLDATEATTVGSVELQKRLATLLATGCEQVALEVSSHALEQDRVADVDIDIAVFSNLSRDHLDYHGTMGAYGAAKQKLFDMASVRQAIINVDDQFGAHLADYLATERDGVEVIRVGNAADVRWGGLRYGDGLITGRWITPWGEANFELPMVGSFAVSNAAEVLAAAVVMGHELRDVVAAQRELPPVPGRMEFVRLEEGPTVVIDYAHTPDALANVLPALRQHCSGELICVIGCGGDRDRGKRPLMAAVAEELADVVWLTSDNPRSEDPESIVQDMRAGLTGESCVYECVDRAEAIVRSISCASGDDLVLVAGKGHEQYQETAAGRQPFSDRQVVVDFVQARAG